MVRQRIGKMSMHGLMSERLLKRFLRSVRNKPRSAADKVESEADRQKVREANGNTEKPSAQALNAGRTDTSDQVAPPDASQKTQ